MLFQEKSVKKWAEDNPEKKYKSWFKTIGWGFIMMSFVFYLLNKNYRG